MASPDTPPSLHLNERLHLNSILALVSLVNRHVNRLLSGPLARISLHLQCTTSLTVKNGASSSFEFSDHSVLSNLYSGIKNLQLAVQAKTPEDKADRLANSEKMLQIPALLDEEGTTLGIANRYIVCCTYFYLCLVSKLRGDEWQMTMHFLQSVLASPGAVKTEFAPDLWRSLFRPQTTDEEARQHVRRYKDWLMYYQVVSYGEAPPIHGSSHLQLLFMDRYRNFGSRRCLRPVARELKFTMLQEVSISTQLINPESSTSDVPTCPMQAENFKADTSYQLSGRSHSAISNLNFSILDMKGTESNSFSKCYIDEETTHEAAIVIYMLNPSPSEIKSLELLPALVEIACNSNSHNQECISLPVTPSKVPSYI